MGQNQQAEGIENAYPNDELLTKAFLSLAASNFCSRLHNSSLGSLGLSIDRTIVGALAAFIHAVNESAACHSCTPSDFLALVLNALMFFNIH